MNSENSGRSMSWIQNIKTMKKGLLIIMIFVHRTSFSQTKMTLDSIFSNIQSNNPQLKMYDAQIRSQDAVAAGARNWEAPQLSTGFWMTPYNPNLWKKQSDGSSGMGQYMISVEQMFPNGKRQDAEEKYLQAMSSVVKENKNASLNELNAAAKQNYVEWMIIKKKLTVLDDNQKLLEFMIKNSELRYQNNLGKVGTYYKVKASLGNLENSRLQLENEIVQKRIILNTLMNRDKTTEFDIDTVFQFRNYNSLTTDSSSLANQRSDIRAVEKDIQLTELQKEVERSKLKPEFGVRYDNMFGFGGQPMQYSLMGVVKLPMTKWSSKASRANVLSLDWKSEALNQQRQMMINTATGMTLGMKNEIVSKQKQIKVFENNIMPALKRNFQSLLLAYEQNTEELFTLYDAWESLNLTQLEYLDEVKQLYLMQVELERIQEIK
jgi:outer membrane protein, heavy metal efflux system